MEEDGKKKIISKEKWLIITITCLIGFGGFVGHVITLQEYDCNGIGGFVYQEIEWAEQTKNVLLENCGYENNPNYVPMLFYDQQKKQFYCYDSYDCDINGCRSKEFYFPIILE